jgi:hypothetical protein
MDVLKPTLTPNFESCFYVCMNDVWKQSNGGNLEVLNEGILLFLEYQLLTFTDPSPNYLFT